VLPVLLMARVSAAFCENLLEQAGPRFAGPIAILRNWTYCLFYVMAELWGSVVVSVLFWGFANQVRHEPSICRAGRLDPRDDAVPACMMPPYANHA
jgi:ATP/ADP translocase